MKYLQIAIDGPVAAGKGTVARLLSLKLGILYVDTGAMYRALALFVKRNKIEWDEEESICSLIKLKSPKVDLKMPKREEKDGRLITTLLDREDVSWQIRAEEISWGVSVITRYRCVRDYMLPHQQVLAKKQSVVMEGRDITTRVLPNANLKIYLDANEKVRAKRRYDQLLKKGENVDFENIYQELKKRDYQDMNRDNDPLAMSEDTWLLDTTDLTIERVVDKILEKLQNINKLGKK